MVHKYLFLKGFLFSIFAGLLVAPGLLSAQSPFAGPTVLAPPAKPAKLPAFEFANLHGGVLKSSDLKGRVIIIRFWAMW